MIMIRMIVLINCEDNYYDGGNSTMWFMYYHAYMSIHVHTSTVWMMREIFDMMKMICIYKYGIYDVWWSS